VIRLSKEDIYRDRLVEALTHVRLGMAAGTYLAKFMRKWKAARPKRKKLQDLQPEDDAGKAFE
jgi:hypothetical protein